MPPIIRLTIRVLAAGLAFGAAAAWTGWLAGQVLTDRFAFSQWLHWIASPIALGLAVVLFACLRIAWPRRRPATGVAHGDAASAPPRRAVRRLAMLLSWAILLGTTGRLAFIEHRLFASGPAEPEGLMVMHWTIGQSSRTPYADIADQVVGRNPHLAILTDAPWIGVESAITQWMAEAEHGRALRFTARFHIFTRLPIREARMIIVTEDVLLVRLVLQVPEMSDGQLEIAIIDLPSDPWRPRREIADEAIDLIRGVEVGDLDLVIGDFNMHRGSHSMRRIVDALMPVDAAGAEPARHAFTEGGVGYAATWSQQYPLWHIDHIWMAETASCSRYETPLANGHRHYPQIAWIRPRPRPRPRG